MALITTKNKEINNASKTQHTWTNIFSSHFLKNAMLLK
jgi:hypothetical protein